MLKKSKCRMGKGNAVYRDETPIGKLMHDFSCSNPSDMYYDLLADRTRFFKESKEGIAVMCKAMEDMRNEAYREGHEDGREDGRIEERRRVLSQMLRAGTYDLKDIASLFGVPVEELEELKRNISK